MPEVAKADSGIDGQLVTHSAPDPATWYQLRMAKPDDAIAAMEDVCLGRATATSQIQPVAYGDGILTFELSNGWTVDVFVDCGIWDYIHRIVAPDGSVLDHATGDPNDPREWHPVFWWSPHGDTERPNGDTHGSGALCRHWGEWGENWRPDGG
jgi:hypothetical protein